MKVVQINATCGIGSTGKICVGISRVMTAENIESYILCSKTNGYPLGISCSDAKYIKMQALKSKVLGNYGFNSRGSTRKMIRELERIRPDIVHLHNIHGHDCDLEMLFSWIRDSKTKVLWTFHDCWALTGYCPHFTMAGCGKWKTQCGHCPQRGSYSWLFDRSRELYEKKKALFTGVDLTIVTPSRWLRDLVKQSFLKDCPVYVIRNGIDPAVFRPTDGQFREKHGLEHKKILLGVSFGWDQKEGLDVFQTMAKCLPDAYQIVLVGTDDETDKMLPDNILPMHRTQNQQELAEIYSAADLFVNPTREDTYPTVNMEALSCGTPVLTFHTGGSPEMLDDFCGAVVPCGDVNAMEREILRICADMPYSEADCLRKAREFDQNDRFKEYVTLYERIVSSGN
jgi:glycosyltransferase involved in cell wall biosynthesis